MKIPFISQNSCRYLFVATSIIFVVVPLVCVGILYFAFIDPVNEKAATFDLSVMTLSDLPADAVHHSISFQEMPEHLIHALISREDPSFYHHSGINYEGLARELRFGSLNRSVKGVSTITQQLSRNSFDLSGHKNTNRLILQLALTRRIEQNFTKAEILHIYLNRIYLGTVAGRSIFGVEAASQAYFNKKTSMLSLPEAALLIGMIRSPIRFSPYRDANAAVMSRNEVIQQMKQDGWITDEEMSLAMKEPLSVRPQP
jgi:penicillin-binding protein 1A